MLIAVTEFNRKRNGLALFVENGLNANVPAAQRNTVGFTNELKMLREEIREFWDAETVAERVDAFVDTEYVWLGTQVKCSYNTYSIPREIKDGIEVSLHLMERYLMEELNYETYHRIINNARDIVCSANAEKGKNLDKDGKVTKDGFTRNATAEISAMIADTLSEAKE